MCSRYEHRFWCSLDMMNMMKKRPVAGSLLICPQQISHVSEDSALWAQNTHQGHTVFLHCISEMYLWSNLIWKCLMTHSYPAAPIFGSRVQKGLTGGDPSASDGHCKWDLQGSRLGTEPLAVFCNGWRMKLDVQRADCRRTDMLLGRKTC